MQKLILFLSATATALLLFAACGGGRAERSIVPAGVRLQAGDVVLRCGTGLAGRIVRATDGSNYSHVGIVVTGDDGCLAVVHAVPGEPDYAGDVDRVKLERVADFYAHTRADRGCVLRCKDSLAARGAARKAMDLYARGTLFDHDYDSTDTARMYCSELVTFAYQSLGVRLVSGRGRNVRLAGLNLEDVVFPSDFLRSPKLVFVTGF